MKMRLLLFSSVMIGVSGIAELADEFPIREIIRHPSKEEIRTDFLNAGKQLMDLKGIPDGDETLICTNWICPTSIVVNAVRYNIVTEEWMSVISADIMTTNVLEGIRATVRIYRKTDAKEARRSVFASLVQSDVLMPVDFAPYIFFRNLDPMTNMMAVCKTYNGVTNKQALVYRNITVFAESPSNVVDFAAEIINAGLPEEDRVPLPPIQ